MSIDVKRLSVRFGGVVALDDVSVRVDPGRIVTVIGPNGSGKSTLFNSITGLVPVTEGTVHIDSEDVTAVSAHRRIAQGLARTFQTPRFDPRVSVEEAVLCGFFPVSSAGIVASMFRPPAVGAQERAFEREGTAILADFGLEDLRHAALGELPMGLVRLVEVARAVANRPRYLLLDEPAAGLTRAEQMLLASEIRRVARSGVGVLLVEHNFGMVRELSDHAVVLDRGRLLAEGHPDDLMRDAAFVSTYLGSSHARHAATMNEESTHGAQ